MVSHMNTNRYTTPPQKRSRTRYKDTGTLFWGGTVVAIGLLAVALYCLLTNCLSV
jgi:hypothetical protein